MADYHYRLTNGTHVVRLKDGKDEAWIPSEPFNNDWVAYQAWLAEGNTPDPAPPPPSFTGDMRDANQRLDAGIAAAQPSMDDATQAQNRAGRARTTEDQIAILQVQVDALTSAMQDMLTAQLGKTPR